MIRIKTIEKLLLVTGILIIPAGISSFEEAKKNNKVEYSKLELKAVRYEMIEQDVYIRTIASMISLNNPERLKYWFEKLSESSLSESKDYKNSIEAVYRKWKKKSVKLYLENVRKESVAMVKYIDQYEKDKFEGIDWSVIEKSFELILENCRGCHNNLEVNIP